MSDFFSILGNAITCVFLAWSPATGPVDHYETVMSAKVESVSTDPASTICLTDTESHIVVIYAVDADDNYSDPSEPIWVQRVFNCDAYGTGQVTIPDLFLLASMVGTNYITVPDVFDCVSKIGTCNNGTYEVECE